MAPVFVLHVYVNQYCALQNLVIICTTHGIPTSNESLKSLPLMMDKKTAHQNGMFNDLTLLLSWGVTVCGCLLCWIFIVQSD